MSLNPFGSRLVGIILGLILITAVPAQGQWRIAEMRHDEFSEIAWDPVRRVLIGLYTESYEGSHEMWEWNGKGWQLRRQGVLRLYDARMIFDPGTEKMVILGRKPSSELYRELEVWSWDGRDLTRMASTMPDRFAVKVPAAYAPHLGGIVVVGHSTWLWRSGVWTQISPQGTIRHNYDPGLLACDTRRNQLYLFSFAAYLNPGIEYDISIFENGGWVKRASIRQPIISDYYSAVSYDEAEDHFLLIFNAHDYRIWQTAWSKAQGAVHSGLSLADTEITYDRFRIESLDVSDGMPVCATPGGVLRREGGEWRPVDPEKRGIIGRSVRYESHLVFDPRRDTLLLFSNDYQSRTFSELRGGAWKSHERAPGSIHSATFSPTFAKTCVLWSKNVPNSIMALLTWDGAKWSRIAGDGPDSTYRGSLYIDPVKGGLYYFAIKNNYSSEPDIPTIWAIDKGAWRQVFSDETIPWDNYTGFLYGAYDWLSGRPLFPGWRDQLYTWDGEQLTNTGQYPLPFITDGLLTRPGGSPVALGERNGNLHLWELSGDRWRRVAEEPYRQCFTYNATKAVFDTLRNRILVLSSDSNRQFALWAWGPYPGPASGKRRLNQSGTFATFYDQLTRRWISASGQLPIVQQGVFPFLGDFDGDRHTQRGVFDPFTGVWRIEKQRSVKRFGRPGDIPVIGDYDGDGSDDIAVYRTATGEWLTRTRLLAKLGTLSCTPVPADYDGDGDTDPAVYDALSGRWHFADGRTIELGNEDCWPVPADYDGDGKVEAAVWNRTTGEWHSQNRYLGTFGAYGDIPAPGPYGIGKAALPALYRPSTGEWIVQGSVVRTYPRHLQPVW